MASPDWSYGRTPRYNPNIKTADPLQMSEQDRIFAYGRGDELDRGIQGRATEQDDLARAYRLRAENVYDPILSGGQGGYGEAWGGNIVREGELDDLRWRPEYEQNLQMTDEERAATQGNPRAGFDYYDPQRTQGIADAGGSRMREAGADEATALRGTVDPSRLRQSEDFGRSMDRDLSSSDAAVREAIDPTRLRQSDDFVARYRMGDRDVQALADQAGRQVGTGTQAAIDDITQRAHAAGNASPLAIGAARARLENQSAVNSADAMANARLAAKREQAGRELDIERGRLDAEGAYSGLRSGAEMQLGNRRTDVGFQREGQRIGAEQGYSDRARDVEGAIGNRRYGTEQDIRDTGLRVNQYNQDTGIDLARGADDRSVDRGRYGTENRQNVTQYSQGQQFGRGMDISNQLSNRYSQAAEAKRADEREARGWLTGQQGMANDNTNTGIDQRIKTYGAMTGAGQNATGTAAQYDLGRRGQSFGTAFKTAAGAGLGKLATSPSSW